MHSRWELFITGKCFSIILRQISANNGNISPWIHRNTTSGTWVSQFSLAQLCIFFCYSSERKLSDSLILSQTVTSWIRLSDLCVYLKNRARIQTHHPIPSLSISLSRKRSSPPSRSLPARLHRITNTKQTTHKLFRFVGRILDFSRCSADEKNTNSFNHYNDIRFLKIRTPARAQLWFHIFFRITFSFYNIYWIESMENVCFIFVYKLNEIERMTDTTICFISLSSMVVFGDFFLVALSLSVFSVVFSKSWSSSLSFPSFYFDSLFFSFLLSLTRSRSFFSSFFLPSLFLSLRFCLFHNFPFRSGPDLWLSVAAFLTWLDDAIWLKNTLSLSLLTASLRR